MSAIRFLCSSSLGLVNSKTAVIQESKKPHGRHTSCINLKRNGISGAAPKSTAPVICDTMALSRGS